VICAVLGAFPGFLPIWQKGAKNANCGKILQTADTVSSKIVVNTGCFTTKELGRIAETADSSKAITTTAIPPPIVPIDFFSCC